MRRSFEAAEDAFIERKRLGRSKALQVNRCGLDQPIKWGVLSALKRLSTRCFHDKNGS